MYFAVCVCVCVCVFSVARDGMRGVMSHVSADLPALIRMCLSDWKAVRSGLAVGAVSGDDRP